MNLRRSKKLTLIGVRVDDEWLSNLERWISDNHPEMSRPEAVCRLVELGLKVQTVEEIKEADSHAAQAAKLATELGLKAKK